MATTSVCQTQIRPVPVAAGPFRLFAPLPQLWSEVRAHFDERRAIHQLYRLDARVLRDMGFDPHSIYAAREGAIGEWKSRRCRD